MKPEIVAHNGLVPVSPCHPGEGRDAIRGVCTRSVSPLLQDRQGSAGSCSTAAQHGVQLFVAAAHAVAVGNAQGRVGFVRVVVVSFSSSGSQDTSSCGVGQRVIAGSLPIFSSTRMLSSMLTSASCG